MNPGCAPSFFMVSSTSDCAQRSAVNNQTGADRGREEARIGSADGVRRHTQHRRGNRHTRRRGGAAALQMRRCCRGPFPALPSF